MNAVLVARNLSFSFPSTGAPLFRDVNLSLRSGEVMAILGLSGSGKTTLCYCLCGIIPLIVEGELEGEVRIDGVRTTEMRPPEIAEKLGVVFQDPEGGLFFPVVEDEVAFGPENLCIPPEEIGHRVHAALRAVGMEDFRHRNPHRLSGGEKQLIATASVLSLGPRVLILDECMSQLDERGRTMMRALILRLREAGKAILMVEHNPENLTVADRMAILDDGRLRPFDGDWGYGDCRSQDRDR
ncbi:MAG: ABC transporter ATP-binding protein [Bacillota bacterium]